VPTHRTVLGVRLEQPDQPAWLFAVNKLWVAAFAHWHRLRVTGAFPSDGPVLLIANHVDGMDPMILAEAIIRVARRSVTMFARSEFFEVPVMSWWLKGSGAIPIRRDQADVGALRSAVGALRLGQVLATFPQATRAYGRQGRFGQIKSGATYIAAKTGVTVVPAAMLGTQAPLLSRGQYEVHFGQAFVVPPLPKRSAPADLDERTRLMEERMLALLPDAYKRDRLWPSSTTAAAAPAADRVGAR
jgi:1-acyl-sn-glycerol-3-phosphate acyltransferase